MEKFQKEELKSLIWNCRKAGNIAGFTKVCNTADWEKVLCFSYSQRGRQKLSNSYHRNREEIKESFIPALYTYVNK